MWLRALALIAWAGGIVLLFVMVIDRDEIFRSVSGAVGATVGVLALAAIGCLSWTTAIVVTITDTKIRVRFRPFRAFTIPRADIASIGTETLSPSAFGGVGLRFVPPHELAFLFTAGPGFVLERTTRPTHYHVRSNHAQQIVTLLRETPTHDSEGT